ncbi:MAG: RraA family protein [Acidobacteria bacterium]|nr:RraA family protein [Acidobacteriota bacterium]
MLYIVRDDSSLLKGGGPVKNGDPSQVPQLLQDAYSGAVFDVLREMGMAHQALPPHIVPLDPRQKLVGPLFTVSGRLMEISEDESLLRWCDLLSQAPEGHVVICQPHDSSLAHMGELSAETLKFRKVKGYIVDGGCRDTSFILKIGFPVFSRYLTPADIVGKWGVEEIGKPIVIGGITIATGDYVVGDQDGIVIIPQPAVEECARRVGEVMHTENRVRKAILQGVDPKEAYLSFGRF